MSFLLVVAGIFSILAMAALAIDVATLYAANSDAQKAADAAALAGAKMFVMSSATSGGGVAPSDVCTNGAGQTTMANAAALAAAQANTVGGATAQITNVACLGTTGTPAPNPRIQVTVGRNNLPLFFARVFGTQTASVSATATAEAYNNSGATGTTWVQTGSVKPWLVENCALGTEGGACPTGFFQPSTNALNNPSAYLGQQMRLVPYGGAGLNPTSIRYYIADPPATDNPNICPSTTQASCGPADGGQDYYSDVSCANQHQVVCGDQLTVSNNNLGGGIGVQTSGAVQCLIHADAAGLGNGQDVLTPGVPVTITNGTNNPNPSIPANSTISTSDSVVTVPVFDFTTDPCNGGTCNINTEKVVGFLQLGIQYVGGTGNVHTVVLNAVGCNSGGSGTPVSGGGVSPVPVRLVQ